MSRRASPRAIGAFVVAGTALAIASVAVFGSGRLFSRSHQFVSYFNANVGGLDPGAPVKFSGVPIGSVEGVFLGLAGLQTDPSASGIPVVFSIDESLISGRGGRVDLGDPAMIDSLINDLGMAASLATESLVTGRQYIELGMYPNRERRFAAVPGAEYTEIPTVRTGFEEVQSQLQDLVAKVAELDLASLLEEARLVVVSARELLEGGDVEGLADQVGQTLDEVQLTLGHARDFFAAADSAVGPLARNLDESVDLLGDVSEEFSGTMGSVREALEPHGRITYRLDVALRDLAEAARSFRALADYLERNPSALVRGRPDNEE